MWKIFVVKYIIHAMWFFFDNFRSVVIDPCLIILQINVKTAKKKKTIYTTTHTNQCSCAYNLLVEQLYTNVYHTLLRYKPDDDRGKEERGENERSY